MVDLSTVYRVSVAALGRRGSCRRREYGGNERVENSVVQVWRDGRRNKRERCERQVCHRIT